MFPKIAKCILSMLIALPLMAGQPSASNASNFVVGSKVCLPGYKKWKRYNGWRAFALNKPNTVKTTQVCGWAYEVDSKSAAIKDAMERCQYYRRKKPNYGIGKCFIIDVRN